VRKWIDCSTTSSDATSGGRRCWRRGRSAPGQELTFWPQIEIAQRGNTIEIRADVPGLKREDLNVEIRDNALCISGERRSETERQEGSVYRSERSYGRFSRSVPLPENVNLENIDATFENGVLTVRIEAPGLERKQARQIEIREGVQQTVTH